MKVDKLYVQHILKDRVQNKPRKEATAFAPTNIALCKYWGKRDDHLNLPITDSLSITLPNKGTTTWLTIIDESQDEIIFNGKKQKASSKESKRIIKFLDLFRFKQWHFKVETENNIPTAAGLASSASGFAALTLALNALFCWQLSKKELSMLARLGSGSASRSVFDEGFVIWHAGVSKKGDDCFSEQLDNAWPALRLGILTLNSQTKSIGSREAMKRTVDTSPIYITWPRQVKNDMKKILKASKAQDFTLLGETAEINALAMHATMLTSKPPINYWQTETLDVMKRIWCLRDEGMTVYFTIDAGSNVKLLFLKDQEANIKKAFPDIEIIELFKPTEVILVDEKDKEIGVEEKLKAHEKGLCHRAFSVFVFNDKKELLLQLRQEDKYHTGNLWTNTCCSHPYPKETIIHAAERRLQEEMGFVVSLKEVGKFHYRALVGDLIENEVDYVFMGTYNNKHIRPNKKEVKDFRWIALDDLAEELKKQPKTFTPWFKQALDLVLSSKIR